MLKVRLLNDGGYSDLENVKFPVVVEGEDFDGQGCDVMGSELIRVGAIDKCRWNPDFFKYHFFYGDECEVINEE